MYISIIISLQIWQQETSALQGWTCEEGKSNQEWMRPYQWRSSCCGARRCLMRILLWTEYLYPSLSSYVEALNSCVEMRPLKNVTEVNEVIGTGPWFSRIGVLKRRDYSKLTLTLCALRRKAMWGLSNMVATSASQEESSTEAKPCLNLDLGLSSLKNCEKVHFYCLKHPINGVRLWQLEPTNTDVRRA